MKGPGETELETDRRIVRDKIALLKKKLIKIDKQAFTQRKNRQKMVRVALVGYTNVGKSTIMRLLSKSDVFAEDKLFATVDSTVRKVVLNNIPFLLTDTVGFIRKLPHGLVESFKSTLDEIREADVLVHVVDISHHAFEDQYKVVRETLAEIDSAEKPTLVVYNKVDKFEIPRDEDNEEIDLKTLVHARSNEHVVFISAQKKTNIDGLRKSLFELTEEKFYTIFPNYIRPNYY